MSESERNVSSFPKWAALIAGFPLQFETVACFPALNKNVSWNVESLNVFYFSLSLA